MVEVGGWVIPFENITNFFPLNILWIPSHSKYEGLLSVEHIKAVSKTVIITNFS